MTTNEGTFSNKVAFVTGGASGIAAPRRCAQNNIKPEIPKIAMSGIDEAWVNVVAKKARYRFVVRCSTLLLGMFVCAVGCEETQASTPSSLADVGPATVRRQEVKVWMTVGERRFAITLTNNAAARALVAQLPLTLEMSELNGNEKHADLEKPLPANASRPGTIRNGDLMLYGTNTLVVFYGTFSSSYAYTRLGRVHEPADLPQALGLRAVRVQFSRD